MQQEEDKKIIASKSRIFSLNDHLDQEDELEKNWSSNYEVIKDKVENLSESEATNKLLEFVNDVSNQSICTTGLLYGYLISENSNPPHFKYLTLVSKDGLSTCIIQLQRLLEKYTKFRDKQRERFINIISEIVKLNINEVEGICINLLRYITNGDYTPKNLWLINNILTIFDKNFLFPKKKLLMHSVYTILSVLPFHYRNQQTANLAQKEVDFCVGILSEKFMDCASIGRDFARVLYDCCFISKLEVIYKTNIEQIPSILGTPTNQRILQNRITPDMEKYLIFMMTEVKLQTNNQRRYQQMYHQKFLSQQESDPLLIDLIRFIVCVFHPSNTIIASNFVPRWMVLGWLIKCVKSQNFLMIILANCVYDWLFYNPKLDSIMNLEPAMLLIVHSTNPKVYDVTSMLLDCLFRHMTAKNWIQSHEIVTSNVQRAIKQLIAKNVVSSLSVIMDCQLINQTIRDTVRNFFPNELKKQALPKIQTSGLQNKSPIKKSPISPNKPTPEIFKPKIANISIFEPHMTNLAEAIATGKTHESMGKIFEIMEKENNQETVIQLGEYFARVFAAEFKNEDVNLHKEKLLKSHNLSILFKRIEVNLQSKEKNSIYENLLKSMSKHEPSIGYRLLCFCFLKSNKISSILDLFDIKFSLEFIQKEIDMKLYHWFLSSRKTDKLSEEEVFLNDIRVFSDDNISLVISFLPIIIKTFESYCKGSIQFFYFIISNCNPIQLNLILNLIQTKRITLIGDGNISKFITSSQQWDYFEKEAFWNIFVSEENPELEFDEFLELLVKSEKEPNFQLISYLSKFIPNYESVKCLMISKSENLFHSTLMLNFLKNEQILETLLSNIISLLKELTINPSTDPKIIQNFIGNFLTIQNALSGSNSKLFENQEIKKWLLKLKEFNLSIENIDFILSEFNQMNKRKIDKMESDENPTPNPIPKKTKKRKIIVEEDE
eukprot:gene5589-9405_t